MTNLTPGPGRPPTTTTHILNHLTVTDWTPWPDLYNNIPGTYPAIMSALYRLIKNGQVERNPNIWHGNASQQGEPSEYRKTIRGLNI